MLCRTVKECLKRFHKRAAIFNFHKLLNFLTNTAALGWLRVLHSLTCRHNFSSNNSVGLNHLFSQIDNELCELLDVNDVLRIFRVRVDDLGASGHLIINGDEVNSFNFYSLTDQKFLFEISL